MAKVSDLSLKDRFWYHRYRFRQVDPLPWAERTRDLSHARVAMVTSAGLHAPDAPPFERVKGGDYSFRWVDGDTDPASLVCSHPSSAWDREGVLADRNLALPLNTLGAMADEGIIGSVAPRHASFQGSITAPGRMMRDTAPEAAQGMADDGVDIVILTPV